MIILRADNLAGDSADDEEYCQRTYEQGEEGLDVAAGNQQVSECEINETCSRHNVLMLEAGREVVGLPYGRAALAKHDRRGKNVYREDARTEMLERGVDDE